MSIERGIRHLGSPHRTIRVWVLVALLRFHWFIRLRWIMILGALGIIGLERVLNPDFHRPLLLPAWLFVLAAINVVWVIARRELVRSTDDESAITSATVHRVILTANAQMAVDLLVLTMLLRYSGGVENPMAIFYLFHMLIAALLLRPLYAVLQGCWAMAAYSTLGLGECLGWIQPHFPFLASTADVSLHTNWFYVVTNICVLGAAVFGMLYFALQISSRLGEREAELIHTNEALEGSQRRIELLQARRSQFLQTAAHQLKSPLTGIQMLAGLIHHNVAPAERIQEVVARIIRRCQEAIAQVTELLTLERVEQAAARRRRHANTYVGQVVEQVVARFAEMAKARNLSLRVDTEESRGARAAVDARDLQDCVSNLIDNAIKYTSPGGAIVVRSSCTAQDISVSVKDTGMGIAEESVGDLFDAFRRGDEALAANIPGSGLGLAIVRAVVEQARGKVEVRSAVGQGAEFIMWFPRKAAPGESAAGIDARSPAPDDTSPPDAPDASRKAHECSTGS